MHNSTTVLERIETEEVSPVIYPVLCLGRDHFPKAAREVQPKHSPVVPWSWGGKDQRAGLLEGTLEVVAQMSCSVGGNRIPWMHEWGTENCYRSLDKDWAAHVRWRPTRLIMAWRYFSRLWNTGPVRVKRHCSHPEHGVETLEWPHPHSKNVLVQNYSTPALTNTKQSFNRMKETFQ